MKLKILLLFLFSVGFVFYTSTFLFEREDVPLYLQQLDVAGEEQFLLPLLLYGPNNQLMGIRNAAFAAHVLGRTLVVPNLVSHYLSGEKTFFASKDIIEIVNSPFTPKVVFMDQFIDRFENSFCSCPFIASRSGHWMFIDRLDILKTHNITLNAKSYTELGPGRHSVEDWRNLLNSKVKFEDRLIVFAIFNPLDWPSALPEQNQEYVKYLNTIQFHRSLIENAYAVVEGKVSDCFVCGHFRPKHDDPKCLSEWGISEYSTPKKCSKKMKPLSWFKENIDKVLEKCPNGRQSNVFLAYFPKMNMAVLNKVRQQYNSVVLSDLMSPDSKLSPFQLSLLEQAICSIADFFIPNPISTWSQTVHLQRLVLADQKGLAIEKAHGTTIDLI